MATESSNTKDLEDLGRRLYKDGPHQVKRTPRRVRAIFNGTCVIDTINARHVWEHPYYPHFYVPLTEIKVGIKEHKLPGEDAVFTATLNIGDRSTDRVLGFHDGQLHDLVRIEFAAMDAWFEEDQRIYGHPKDPYKRIDILPSSRRITIRVDGVTVAESSQNLFLYETMLRPRYYMPMTSANFKYLSPSKTTTLCPYKGTAEYFNLTIDGKVYEDLVWWYRYPTAESAPIAGHLCFYNEKVDVLVDEVLEEK